MHRAGSRAQVSKGVFGGGTTGQHKIQASFITRVGELVRSYHADNRGTEQEKATGLGALKRDKEIRKHCRYMSPAQIS